MFLSDLTLANFRNHADFQTNFSKNANVIVGKNGIGKTNILESIFMLSTTISQRTSFFNELVFHGKDNFLIKGNIIENYGNIDISINYKNSNGIKTFLNSSAVKRRDLLSKFPVVIFSPEDIDMIKGSPDKLRRTLNVVMSQTSSSYVNLLSRYKKILVERNALLRNINSRNSSLDAWTDTLIDAAAKLNSMREKFIFELNEIINREINEMGLSKSLKIIYNISNYNGNVSIENDLKKGYTSWGPHRDKYTFYFNNKNLRKYGSRGETRIAALIFRLSIWKIFKEKINEEPIVLLDDVFSELDKEKRRIVERRLKDVQSILALTEIPSDFSLDAEIITL